MMSVKPSRSFELADLGLDLDLFGFGDPQAVLGRHHGGLGGPGCGFAVVEGRLAGGAGFDQFLGAGEGGLGGLLVGLGLGDRASGLGEGGLGADTVGLELRGLGLQRVVGKPREHLAGLHPVAFFGEHFADPVALDLRRDQHFTARDQRSGDQDGLGEFHRLGRNDAHGRPLGLGLGLGGIGGMERRIGQRHRQPGGNQNGDKSRRHFVTPRSHDLRSPLFPPHPLPPAAPAG